MIVDQIFLIDQSNKEKECIIRFYNWYQRCGGSMEGKRPSLEGEIGNIRTQMDILMNMIETGQMG